MAIIHKIQSDSRDFLVRSRVVALYVFCGSLCPDAMFEGGVATAMIRCRTACWSGHSEGFGSGIIGLASNLHLLLLDPIACFYGTPLILRGEKNVALGEARRCLCAENRQSYHGESRLGISSPADRRQCYDLRVRRRGVCWNTIRIKRCWLRLNYKLRQRSNSCSNDYDINVVSVP